MEISKKDIQCVEIVKKVERLTSQVRKFIRLVNRQLPKAMKLNKEHFIILREDGISFLNDGNTMCAGLDYQVIWAYTSSDVETKKEDIIQRQQYDAVTFTLQCKERCYDHRKDSLHFFSLYYKGLDSESDEIAERIDYINDNYDENHLFRPYELMQVVWRIRNEFYLDPSNISPNRVQFRKFMKTFEKEEIKFGKLEFTYLCNTHVKQELPIEVLHNIEYFEEQVSRFAAIVNCYCAVASKKVDKEDMNFFWNAQKKEFTVLLVEAITQFAGKKAFLENYKFLPKKFTMEQYGYSTLGTPSERDLSFYSFDCLKCTVGYSYFNEYIFAQGIPENWHPRLFYFCYYISKDFKEIHYTISLTSCEGRFRENHMTIIEASTLEELLTPENAIKIAKWMEEIWRKTALIYYYSSIIKEEKIRNFSSTCEIDK